MRSRAPHHPVPLLLRWGKRKGPPTNHPSCARAFPKFLFPRILVSNSNIITPEAPLHEKPDQFQKYTTNIPRKHAAPILRRWQLQDVCLLCAPQLLKGLSSSSSIVLPNDAKRENWLREGLDANVVLWNTGMDLLSRSRRLSTTSTMRNLTPTLVCVL